MGRIYSYQYVNGGVDVASITTPAVALADVLEVSRNGIGMQPGTYANETVTTDVIEYTRRSFNTNVPDTNKYIIAVSNIPGTTTRTIVYEFGSLVTIGDTYRFETNALSGVEYVVQSGDTVTDVRNEIKTLIDAATWPGFTVSTSSISTNRLEVTYSTLFHTFKTLIVYGVKYLFQKGYYVTIAGKDYLITSMNSNTAYPTLPAIAATYNFGDLTLMPSGLIPYINNPSYTQDYFILIIQGTADILGVPTAGSMGMGMYVYSQTEQKLTFAEALQPGEYIKMLYK